MAVEKDKKLIDETPPVEAQANEAQSDEQLLRQALTASLLRLTAELEKAADEKPKPPWRVFLESTGGAALITVLIGGLLGASISSCFQKNAKEREFQQTLVKARTDQALIAYKDFIEKRDEFVGTTLQMVGATMSAADNYAQLVKKEYQATDGDPKAVQDKKKEHWTQIANEYNASDTKWSAECDSLKSQMSNFFQDQPEVTESFTTVEEKVNAYKICVKALVKGEKTTCEPEKTAVGESIKAFDGKQSHRTHIWKELTDPKEIQKLLKEIADAQNQ